MKKIKLEKDLILSGEKIDVVNIDFSIIPNFGKNQKKAAGNKKTIKDMLYSNVIFLEH